MGKVVTEMPRHRSRHINTDGQRRNSGRPHHGRGRGTGQGVPDAVKSDGENTTRPR